MQAVHIEATWTSRELLRWNLSSLVSHLLREGWLLPHYSAKNSWILGKNGKKCLHAITILVNSPHWRWKEKKKNLFSGESIVEAKRAGNLGPWVPWLFHPNKKRKKKKSKLAARPSAWKFYGEPSYFWFPSVMNFGCMEPTPNRSFSHGFCDCRALKSARKLKGDQRAQPTPQPELGAHKWQKQLRTTTRQWRLARQGRGWGARKVKMMQERGERGGNLEDEEAEQGEQNEEGDEPHEGRRLHSSRAFQPVYPPPLALRRGSENEGSRGRMKRSRRPPSPLRLASPLPLRARKPARSGHPPPPPLKPPPRSAPRFPWRGQPWRALPEKRGLGSKALINEQENQILPFLIREERGPNQWKRRLLDADHRRHRRHYKAACSYFFSHFYATEMTKSVIGPAFFTPCSNIIRAITAHLPIIPFLVAEKKNLPKNRNWRSHI